jgi:hypothetical protein
VKIQTEYTIIDIGSDERTQHYIDCGILQARCSFLHGIHVKRKRQIKSTNERKTKRRAKDRGGRTTERGRGNKACGCEIFKVRNPVIAIINTIRHQHPRPSRSRPYRQRKRLQKPRRGISPSEIHSTSHLAIGLIPGRGVARKIRRQMPNNDQKLLQGTSPYR